ncbi:aminodeoxychorismate synthase component I [Nocardia pseudovaccinii]|uniref:aminodeoxychorismate synthase component I n=1 Tax=Nocardia pseudovaccinii TaxID=189540 RepID=UPI0007A521E6|nr:aminodeoxychorismate synthase component I [Nocardia pseudovaccinii]
MSLPAASGRFDDLIAGSSWCFPEIAYVLEAFSPGQVRDVLREAEFATLRGWWAFGFVAYEAASGLDPALTSREPVDGLPLAWFGVCREPQAAPPLVRALPVKSALGDWACHWTEEHHRQQVERVRQEIAAGETYQCNLTTRLTADFSGRPKDLYAGLALAQGGSYNAYIDIGRFVIASASPELFFETAGVDLRMRPMKGTAPRGHTDAEDAAIAAGLRASEKERAENIMIVDLIRNDVAKLAVTGGVSVRSLCRAERYETVHQLTSEVTARLRPGIGLEEMFGALFPSGSVTGAPKVRTMRLIRGLEEESRGVYCGAIGMIAPPGTSFGARFSVAIRTILIDRDRATATYGSGGGITWASDPAAEYAELHAKAALLTRLNDR